MCMHDEHVDDVTQNYDTQISAYLRPGSPCDRVRAAFVQLIEPFPWSQAHDINKSCDMTANHYTS